MFQYPTMTSYQIGKCTITVVKGKWTFRFLHINSYKPTKSGGAQRQFLELSQVAHLWALFQTLTSFSYSADGLNWNEQKKSCRLTANRQTMNMFISGAKPEDKTASGGRSRNCNLCDIIVSFTALPDGHMTGAHIVDPNDLCQALLPTVCVFVCLF